MLAIAFENARAFARWDPTRNLFTLTILPCLGGGCCLTRGVRVLDDHAFELWEERGD